MPAYISRVTSKVVVEEAAGLDREQMQEIVAAVLKALKEEEGRCQESEQSTQIRGNARPESPFE